MKILTVVGARPQFIKAAIVSKKIKEIGNGIEEVLVHTGQHYDERMSQVFFNQMGISQPTYKLAFGNLSHGAMTGRILESIEQIILKERPDYVMVYGDTNSTLAGSLAAAKTHIPVANIEAGLRSFNMNMPEEINRILTDQVSCLLFCPTDQSVINLKNEGFERKKGVSIIKNGDVMYDAALYFSKFSSRPDFPIPPNFVLATLHRAENTDDIVRLNEIVESLNKINTEISVILPLHPRTKKIIKSNRISIDFTICEPLGYFQMLYMLKKASLVMTDSGGLQKEAYFFKKPCVTLRDETERVELVNGGYNKLAGAQQEKILEAYHSMLNQNGDFSTDSLYGNGRASEMVAKYLVNLL